MLLLAVFQNEVCFDAFKFIFKCHLLVKGDKVIFLRILILLICLPLDISLFRRVLSEKVGIF